LTAGYRFDLRSNQSSSKITSLFNVIQESLSTSRLKERRRNSLRHAMNSKVVPLMNLFESASK